MIVSDLGLCGSAALARQREAAQARHSAKDRPLLLSPRLAALVVRLDLDLARLHRLLLRQADRQHAVTIARADLVRLYGDSQVEAALERAERPLQMDVTLAL